MATSPIYSWPEPDNTDLVKNGALAIRTLGNAIDTTMGTMVAKTIIDAKGDLIAGTANDTAARLAVGNNGETLVADSSTSTGLRYSAGNPIPNPILNSAMQNWQRGTSFSLAANAAITYLADRWCSRNTGAATTVSRQVTGDTTNLPNIQYALRYQRNSGQTLTAENYLTQCFETVNSIPYAGKTVTMSFYARAGANYSPTSGLLEYQLYSGTGTDQNLHNGYTGLATAVNSTATLTTTWQRFSATGTVSASSTELSVNFTVKPTGTASTNDYYEITGVQIDIGSVALPFRTYAGTIQGELAACQRYYFASSTSIIWGGNTTSGSSYYVTYPWKVTMRVNPTVITTSGGASGFASGAPSGADVKTNEGWFSNVANATASGSYFQFSLTASAEL